MGSLPLVPPGKPVSGTASAESVDVEPGPLHCPCPHLEQTRPGAASMTALVTARLSVVHSFNITYLPGPALCTRDQMGPR